MKTKIKKMCSDCSLRRRLEPSERLWQLVCAAERSLAVAVYDFLISLQVSRCGKYKKISSLIFLYDENTISFEMWRILLLRAEFEFNIKSTFMLFHGWSKTTKLNSWSFWIFAYFKLILCKSTTKLLWKYKRKTFSTSISFTWAWKMKIKHIQHGAFKSFHVTFFLRINFPL